MSTDERTRSLYYDEGLDSAASGDAVTTDLTHSDFSGGGGGGGGGSGGGVSSSYVEKVLLLDSVPWTALHTTIYSLDIIVLLYHFTCLYATVLKVLDDETPTACYIGGNDAVGCGGAEAPQLPVTFGTSTRSIAYENRSLAGELDQHGGYAFDESSSLYRFAVVRFVDTSVADDLCESMSSSLRSSKFVTADDDEDLHRSSRQQWTSTVHRPIDSTAKSSYGLDHRVAAGGGSNDAVFGNSEFVRGGSIFDPTPETGGSGVGGASRYSNRNNSVCNKKTASKTSGGGRQGKSRQVDHRLVTDCQPSQLDPFTWPPVPPSVDVLDGPDDASAAVSADGPTAAGGDAGPTSFLAVFCRRCFQSVDVVPRAVVAFVLIVAAYWTIRTANDALRIDFFLNAAVGGVNSWSATWSDALRRVANDLAGVDERLNGELDADFRRHKVLELAHLKVICELVKTGMVHR